MLHNVNTNDTEFPRSVNLDSDFIRSKKVSKLNTLSIQGSRLNSTFTLTFTTISLKTSSLGPCDRAHLHIKKVSSKSI